MNDSVYVKRLLRHRGSKQYFKDGSWTRNPQEARSFADIVEAAETCAQYDLKDVELALQHQDGAEVFCTSVR